VSGITLLAARALLTCGVAWGATGFDRSQSRARCGSRFLPDCCSSSACRGSSQAFCYRYWLSPALKFTDAAPFEGMLGCCRAGHSRAGAEDCPRSHIGIRARASSRSTNSAPSPHSDVLH
jgi:hypothetical protein